MAQVLCKGKPYTPPVLHGYTFVARFDAGELPPEDAIWAADVAEGDFHKFMLGVEGSPFWLEDETVVVPPPPAPETPSEGSDIKVPGAVPSSDPEALARLQLAAAASGALDAPSGSPEAPLAPLVPQVPLEGGKPAEDGKPADTGNADAPAADAVIAEAYAPYAALRSKLEIATLAKANLGLEMDPENSKMAEMLDLVKAELAKRAQGPAPENSQA